MRNRQIRITEIVLRKRNFCVYLSFACQFVSPEGLTGSGMSEKMQFHFQEGIRDKSSMRNAILVGSL